MARSPTFKILLAYEAHERFAAIIRSQEMARRGTEELTSAFEIECGFGKSDWPDHADFWEQTAEAPKLINSGE